MPPLMPDDRKGALMKARLLAGAFLILIGLVSFYLGILFFIAGMGELTRYATGGFLTGAGITCVIAGVKALFAGARGLPRAVKKDMLNRAHALRGLCEEKDLTGHSANPAIARAQIESFLSEGFAKKIRAGDRTLLIFPEFYPGYAQKICASCRAAYPAVKEITQCPSCGRELITGAGKSSASGNGSPKPVRSAISKKR